MKKKMKETVSIERWMKALNRFLLKNGSSMEQMRWKSQQPAPANNRGAFDDTAENSGLINLVRGGGWNNSTAVSKISCPVIDMTQYSFEDQMDGKGRKIEYMGIRYNATGGSRKGGGKNNNDNEIKRYYSCGMIQESLHGPWIPDQQKRGTGTMKIKEGEEVNRRK
jgi:hypothetical protein